MATKKTSPTARTKPWLRAQGYCEGTVEMRVPIPGVDFQPLRDFCNFADIIAFDATLTIAVQATSNNGGNVTNRVKKILLEPRAWLWCQPAHRQIWVIGWKRYAEAVDRKWWRPTVTVVTPAQFDPAVVAEAKYLAVAG